MVFHYKCTPPTTGLACILQRFQPFFQISVHRDRLHNRLIWDELHLTWREGDICQLLQEVETKICSEVGQFLADRREHTGKDTNVLLDQLYATCSLQTTFTAEEIKCILTDWSLKTDRWLQLMENNCGWLDLVWLSLPTCAYRPSKSGLSPTQI